MSASIMHYPKQAVILAGGRGVRLRPITDTIPKAMIHFHGKPFLEYLLEQIRNQGIENVLLLLGYLPDVIREYFGDGRKWGLHIEYSVTDVNNDTGERMRLAAPLLNPYFLFLYCDNYCPMDLYSLWSAFLSHGKKALITVYSNEDGYTRSNIKVNSDGFVSLYDKTRRESGLLGVDIGYGVFSREIISLIPSGNVNFEATVYPRLIQQGILSAALTRHRYYSVGALERLPIMESFLARRPTVFLDRDGVLNVKPPRACYVTSPEEFHWLPGALDAVCHLKSTGIRVIIISNQAGIARGVMTHESLDIIHSYMRSTLRRHSSDIDAIYVCPHGWDEGCFCRKPEPGLFFRAQRDFDLDLSRCIFIGDDERDVEAGRRAGCPTILLRDGDSLLDVVLKIVIPELTGQRKGMVDSVC